MREIKCRNCFNYRNEWCEKINDSPDPDIVRDCQYFKQKSNADRIRAMTDEELAELLANETHRIAKPVFDSVGYGIEKQVIYARRLNWLQQPCGGADHE